jgi:hypothetical protein
MPWRYHGAGENFSSGRCETFRRRFAVRGLKRDPDLTGDPSADLNVVNGMSLRLVEDLQRGATRIEEHPMPAVVFPRGNLLQTQASRKNVVACAKSSTVRTSRNSLIDIVYWAATATVKWVT